MSIVHLGLRQVRVISVLLAHMHLILMQNQLMTAFHVPLDITACQVGIQFCALWGTTVRKAQNLARSTHVRVVSILTLWARRF